MSDQPPLTFLGVGTEGLLFTDGARLFLVWQSNTDGVAWMGMEVPHPDAAFPTIYPDWCGAEIDMRQTDDDPMTPEVMELGDRMAEALNLLFRETEKRITAEWKTRRGSQSA
jgi:hypothetical protein